LERVATKPRLFRNEAADRLEELTVPSWPVPWGSCLAFRDFSSLRTHFRAAYCNRRGVDTRFRLLKYCSRSEPGLENCDSRTLRFSEVSDFSLSFCLRHPAAWPTAFQITFKNNSESSLFELLRDVFSKNFQNSLPFVWFFMFIFFHKYGIIGCIEFPLYDMRRLYVKMVPVNQFHEYVFLAYRIIAFGLPYRL
jgi:hypothetical protein